MRYIILLLLISSCATFNKTKVFHADFAITHMGDSTSSCTTEKAKLVMKQGFLASVLDMQFISSQDTVIITKAYRSEARSYSYSGYDSSGRKFDIVVGTPWTGDAIIAFRDQKNWTVVDYKCRKYRDVH